MPNQFCPPAPEITGSLPPESVILDNLATLATSIYEQQNLSLGKEMQLKFLEEKTSIEMYLISAFDFRILYANQNALNSLGYPRNFVLNKSITEILTTTPSNEFESRLADLQMNAVDSFSTFAEQINRDGSKSLVKLYVSSVTEGDDATILIIARNLSGAGVESDLINYLVNYDSIPGMSNHRMFEKLLEDRIHISADTSEKAGLLLISLRNFNLLNKSFGYRVGDQITRILSELIGRIIEPNGNLIRTSQDSFCIFLPNANESRLERKAMEILDLINVKDFFENGKKFKMHANIGGVIFNLEDSKETDFLSMANIACDIAKESGEDQFYLVDLQDEIFIQKNVEMEQFIDVQDAIECNRLMLYGQKIACVSNSAPKYAEHIELLIRMIDDRENLVLPMSFIPHLEKYGSIVSLDKWVLNESLSEIDVRFRNLDGFGSLQGSLYNINLSARTIADGCFVKYCTDLLNKYKHLAPYLCFEITETVAISNFNIVQSFIQTIRQFGCKFALDDFGSGGASLEYLKKLPVDFVKIDGAFVSDIVENPVSKIIVESICQVAKVLKMDVIAEKVETFEVERELMKYGVDYIQGFKVQTPSPFGSQVEMVSVH